MGTKARAVATRRQRQGRAARVPGTREFTSRKRGRPTNFSPALAEKLVEAVREHYHVSVAARLCNVHPKTVLHWLAVGDRAAAGEGEAPPEISEFSARVRQKQAEHTIEQIAAIKKAGKGGYKVAETVTENEAPDGSRQTVTTRKYAHPAWQASAWVTERTARREWAPPERPGERRGAEGPLDPKLDAFLEAIGRVIYNALPKASADELCVEIGKSVAGIWNRGEPNGALG